MDKDRQALLQKDLERSTKTRSSLCGSKLVFWTGYILVLLSVVFICCSDYPSTKTTKMLLAVLGCLGAILAVVLVIIGSIKTESPKKVASRMMHHFTFGGQQSTPGIIDWENRRAHVIIQPFTLEAKPDSPLFVVSSPLPLSILPINKNWWRILNLDTVNTQQIAAGAARTMLQVDLPATGGFWHMGFDYSPNGTDVVDPIRCRGFPPGTKFELLKPVWVEWQF